MEEKILTKNFGLENLFKIDVYIEHKGYQAVKKALEKIESAPTKRLSYGMRLLEKGIARQGCQVIKNEKVIGEVTSGTFSPTLGEGIALVLVHTPLQIGERVQIQIRQNLCHAQVVELPFVRKTA